MTEFITTVKTFLGQYAWGQTALTIVGVLGTLVAVGQSLEFLLPQATKDKIDEASHNSIIAAILQFLRAFSFTHPNDWKPEDSETKKK